MAENDVMPAGNRLPMAQLTAVVSVKRHYRGAGKARFAPFV
jgi:hypothetical protein